MANHIESSSAALLRNGDALLRPSIEDLSPREREILSLAAKGLTDKEICQQIHVSLTTVRTYWERLRQKTRTSNRASAVAMFARGSSAPAEFLPVEETLLDKALQSVFGGIVVLNVEDRIVAVSDSFTGFVNLPRCTLEGAAIDALVERRCGAFYDAIDAARKGLSERRTVSAFFRTHLGRDVLSSVTVASLFANNEPYTTLYVQDLVAELDARRRGMRSGPVLTYGNPE